MFGVSSGFLRLYARNEDGILDHCRRKDACCSESGKVAVELFAPRLLTYRAASARFKNSATESPILYFAQPDENAIGSPASLVVIWVSFSLLRRCCTPSDCPRDRCALAQVRIHTLLAGLFKSPRNRWPKKNFQCSYILRQTPSSMNPTHLCHLDKRSAIAPWMIDAVALLAGAILRLLRDRQRLLLENLALTR